MAAEQPSRAGRRARAGATRCPHNACLFDSECALSDSMRRSTLKQFQGERIPHKYGLLQNENILRIVIFYWCSKTSIYVRMWKNRMCLR